MSTGLIEAAGGVADAFGIPDAFAAVGGKRIVPMLNTAEEGAMQKARDAGLMPNWSSQEGLFA